MESVTLALNSVTPTWTDTGFVLAPYNDLVVAASGSAVWGEGGSSTPVGTSIPGGGTWATGPFNIVPTFALALLLLPDGQTPPAPTLDSIDPTPATYNAPPAGGIVLGPGLGRTYTWLELAQMRSSGSGGAFDLEGAPGELQDGPLIGLATSYRVWAIFNDNVYTDNAGTYSVTLTAYPTQLPQGATLTFPRDPIDLPLLGGALWAVYRNDVLVDSGDRFDRKGAAGWGVEPAASGGLIVTAPWGADVGAGYEASYNAGSGAFPTASFEVTSNSPSSEGSGATMPRHLFSTGLLLVSIPLPTPTLTRVAIGSPAAATLPLANLVDADTTTLADFPETDEGDKFVLQIDLGSSQPVGRLIAWAVTLGGTTAGKALLCYVSATALVGSDFSGMTEFVAGTSYSADDTQFIPAGGAASVSGRYIYLVPHLTTGVTIGDIDIRGTEYQLGALQTVGLGFAFQSKFLRGATWLSQYPLDNAYFDGSATLQCESADINANAVNMMTGAMVSGTNPILITASTTTKPLGVTAEFRGQDTAGLNVVYVSYLTYFPGFTWGMKRDDFSFPSFTGTTFLKDVTGRAWRLICQL